MNENLIAHELSEIRAVLARIAAALAEQQPAPAFRRPLEAYPGFDWATIGATVTAQDRHGATRVMYRGREYTRRTHQRYGTAIWFSRAAGRDESGDVNYERLITFAPEAAVEDLPAGIARELETPSPASATAPAAAQTEQTEKPKANAPANPASFQILVYQIMPQAIAAGLSPQKANEIIATARRNDSWEQALAEVSTFVDEHK